MRIYLFITFFHFLCLFIHFDKLAIYRKHLYICFSAVRMNCFPIITCVSFMWYTSFVFFAISERNIWINDLLFIYWSVICQSVSAYLGNKVIGCLYVTNILNSLCKCDIFWEKNGTNESLVYTSGQWEISDNWKWNSHYSKNEHIQGRWLQVKQDSLPVACLSQGTVQYQKVHNKTRLKQYLLSVNPELVCTVSPASVLTAISCYLKTVSGQV